MTLVSLVIAFFLDKYQIFRQNLYENLKFDHKIINIAFIIIKSNYVSQKNAFLRKLFIVQ